MKKADSNSSAGINAGSEQKVEDISVSQHSRKPDVVGSPLLSESYLKSDLSTQRIVDKILKELSGFTIGQAKRTLRIASHCVYTVSEKIEAEQFFA